MSTQEVGGRSINTWENVVQREREFHAGNQHHMEQLQLAMEHLRAGGSKGDSSSSSSSDGSNEPQSNEDRDFLQDLNHQTASALALDRSPSRPSIFEIPTPKSPNAGADSFQQNGLHNSLPNFAAAGAQQHFFAQTVMESTRQQDHIPYNSANNNINNSSQVHQHSSPSRTFFQSHDLQQLLPSQSMEMGNHHHQVQETVFPMAISASPMRNYGNIANYGAMNSSSNNNAYHLPTSNLPPEYRLDSSSKLHLPQMHQSYFQDNVNGYPTKYSQWPNWHLQTSMNDHSQAMASQQEIQFQELMNQPTGGSSFYPTGGSSSPTQFPNMQIQPGMNPYSIRSHSDHPHLESVMGNRLTMVMPDNSPSSTLPSWLSQAQNPPGSSPVLNSRPRPPKSGIYDPIYEAMGLPVDPHLRVFLAKRDDNDA